VIRVDYV